MKVKVVFDLYDLYQIWHLFMKENKIQMVKLDEHFQNKNRCGKWQVSPLTLKISMRMNAACDFK
jgi:hypothetical protein